MIVVQKYLRRINEDSLGLQKGLVGENKGIKNYTNWNVRLTGMKIFGLTASPIELVIKNTDV